MKNTFLYILICMTIQCKAQQIYSLRPTEINLPENSYQKDTNNELSAYEGTWKGTWGNKIIFLTLKKIINKYDDTFKYYKDYLIGRFKVLDISGNILFDNTNLGDNNTKIKGINFRKYNDKYTLIYVDSDLCNTSGNIIINFTNSSQTQLNWVFNNGSNIITSDCPYYNTTPFPQALPDEIILTKQ